MILQSSLHHSLTNETDKQNTAKSIRSFVSNLKQKKLIIF